MNFKLTKRACYIGYFVQAIINNLSPLFFIIFQEDFGISTAALGCIVFVNFITQLLVDALSVKFIAKIGERRSVLLAHILSATGLILLSVLPFLIGNTFVGILIATVISAVGSGLIEVMISPIVDRIPSEKSAAEMSLLHSFYCIGHIGVVLLSTLFFAISGINLWWCLPIIWALVPFVNTFIFMKTPFPEEISSEERIPLRSLIKTKTFLLFGLLMLCGGAAEQSVAQWASFFAEKTLGVSKSVGDLLGPCMFALFMGIGRILYGFFGEKYPIKKALTIFASLSVIAYIITSLSPFPFLSLISLGLCGFSVSIMWPGVLSLSSERYKTGGTPMFAILALFGDLGCAAGPFFAGMMSGYAESISIKMDGFKFGILAAVIFTLTMVILLSLYNHKKTTRG